MVPRIIFVAVLGLAACRVGAEPLVPVSTVLPVDPNEILIVDLKDEARLHLDTQMKRGIVVVKWDPRIDPKAAGATPLQFLDCQADGAYTFMGADTRNRVLKLDNANKTGANLPFSAFGLNNQLGAKFFAENALDVALKLVGERSTARSEITKDDLSGPECGLATHFIKSTAVGAFAITEVNKSQNDYTINVWELASEHKDHQNLNINWQDGDPSACDHAKSSDTEPIDQCGVAVYARLESVGPAGKPRTLGTPPPVQIDDEPCPRGNGVRFVRAVAKDAAGKVSLGECTDDASALHVCAIEDAAECAAECAAGEPNSCGKLGFDYQYAGGGVAIDLAKSSTLYTTACTGGVPFGCAGLGVLAAKKSPPDFTSASAFLKKACDAGNARGCQGLGALIGDPKNAPGVAVDPVAAYALFTRACSGGDPTGCFDQGFALENGTGTTQDQAAAVVPYRASCDGGFPDGCKRLGLFYAFGAGGLGADPNRNDRAVYYLDLACRGEPGPACDARDKVKAGQPVPQNL